MKYLFVIQGEGRGHYTQALSLKTILRRNGNEVVGVMVGKSKDRVIPEFFRTKMGEDITEFTSPNFIPSPKGKKSFLLLSIIYNLFLIPTYVKSILLINKKIEETQPDVVVNFYELMCGFTFAIMRPKSEMINIAHQYYFLTPEFNYTGKKQFQFLLLKFHTCLTALGSNKILALSFRKGRNKQYGKITIVPPLLRNEVMQTISREGDYIHGYMLNPGYAKELEQWSTNYPDQELHFFWDKKNVQSITTLTPMLTVHQLSDSLFIHYMSGCKAYATTAGFESICEAMFLQKPILMVPTHIEQECNAIDASNSGAGIISDEFDLNQLIAYVPYYNKTRLFQYWVRSAETIIMQELTFSEYNLSNAWTTI